MLLNTRVSADVALPLIPRFVAFGVDNAILCLKCEMMTRFVRWYLMSRRDVGSQSVDRSGRRLKASGPPFGKSRSKATLAKSSIPVATTPLSALLQHQSPRRGLLPHAPVNPVSS